MLRERLSQGFSDGPLGGGGPAGQLEKGAGQVFGKKGEPEPGWYPKTGKRFGTQQVFFFSVVPLCWAGPNYISAVQGGGSAAQLHGGGGIIHIGGLAETESCRKFVGKSWYKE